MLGENAQESNENQQHYQQHWKPSQAYLCWDVQGPVWDVQVADDEDKERHGDRGSPLDGCAVVVEGRASIDHRSVLAGASVGLLRVRRHGVG